MTNANPIRHVAAWFRSLYVSFSFEHEVKDILRAPHELVYELQGLSDEDLQGKTIGVDRSVKANCLATSCGTFHALERVNLERIRRKELGAQRHQRRLARARKGAANRRKLIQKLARKKVYKAQVLQDCAHKTSHALAESGARLITFEDLKIQNMVRRPRARQDAKGLWLQNRAAAKAGLKPGPPAMVAREDVV